MTRISRMRPKHSNTLNHRERREHKEKKASRSPNAFTRQMEPPFYSSSPLCDPCDLCGLRAAFIMVKHRSTDLAQSPVLSFEFRHSFGFRHSSFGFGYCGPVILWSGGPCARS